MNCTPKRLLHCFFVVDCCTGTCLHRVAWHVMADNQATYFISNAFRGPVRRSHIEAEVDLDTRKELGIDLHCKGSCKPGSQADTKAPGVWQ